jgi:hypothetical protein
MATISDARFLFNLLQDALKSALDERDSPIKDLDGSFKTGELIVSLRDGTEFSVNVEPLDELDDDEDESDDDTIDDEMPRTIMVDGEFDDEDKTLYEVEAYSDEEE